MDKSYSIIYAFYGVELRDDNHRLLINVPDLAKHIEDLDYEESIKAFTNQFNIRYLQSFRHSYIIPFVYQDIAFKYLSSSDHKNAKLLREGCVLIDECEKQGNAQYIDKILPISSISRIRPIPHMPNEVNEIVLRNKPIIDYFTMTTGRVTYYIIVTNTKLYYYSLDFSPILIEIKYNDSNGPMIKRSYEKACQNENIKVIWASNFFINDLNADIVGVIKNMTR